MTNVVPVLRLRLQQSLFGAALAIRWFPSLTSLGVPGTEWRWKEHQVETATPAPDSVVTKNKKFYSGAGKNPILGPLALETDFDVVVVGGGIVGVATAREGASEGGSSCPPCSPRFRFDAGRHPLPAHAHSAHAPRLLPLPACHLPPHVLYALFFTSSTLAGPGVGVCVWVASGTTPPPIGNTDGCPSWALAVQFPCPGSVHVAPLGVDPAVTGSSPI